jgi:hypothetical protein
MWRFLPPLRRAEVELPVAIHNLDASSVLPWIECLGRIHRQDRDVCATRVTDSARNSVLLKPLACRGILVRHRSDFLSRG